MVGSMYREPATTLSVLRGLDTAGLRAEVHRETRARQHRVPPVSVYRWWARRTDSISGAIVDALAAQRPGQRLLIADPFSGGGVIALAAVVRGHRVYAQDVNPWAARSLTTMLDLPDAGDLSAAADRLHSMVGELLGKAYDTTMSDGSPGTIVHTIRVAKGACPGCSCELRLYPLALVSLTNRIDAGGSTGYVACSAGHLNLGSAVGSTKCETCGRKINPEDRYTTGRIASCVECGWTGRLSELCGARRLNWDVALVERAGNGHRELGPPNANELSLADPAQWHPERKLPKILAGSETRSLIKYGMHYWHDLYPTRQRVVLEALLVSCHEATDDSRVVRALEAAVIGSVEMAGHLSRWDAKYLKSYEAIANHRFNFTTLPVEPNVWGAGDLGRGTVSRRLEQIAKASIWLDERVGRHLVVDGPCESSDRRSPLAARFDARIVSGSSGRITLPAGHLDAIVTDPPYHDDVQYGELSDLFRAWAGDLTGPLLDDAVAAPRSEEGTTELYRSVLTKVFDELHRALRPAGHLVLSYANRDPAAWVALLSALQDAGFVGLGYTVVLSENDGDHAKAGKRACNLDVLLDLVKEPSGRIRRYRPSGEPKGDEEEFGRIVGEQFLHVGAMAEGWEDTFVCSMNQSAFLA
jgi:putative DNA methylase